MKYQRGGFGLGGLFGGLLRSILPVMGRVGKSVAKQALQTGVQVASDVLQGENISDSLENRGKTAAAKLLKKGAKASGLAKNKKKNKRNNQKGGSGGGLGAHKSRRFTRKVRGRTRQDIFGR